MGHHLSPPATEEESRITSSGLFFLTVPAQGLVLKSLTEVLGDLSLESGDLSLWLLDERILTKGSEGGQPSFVCCVSFKRTQPVTESQLPLPWEITTYLLISFLGSSLGCILYSLHSLLLLFSC